MQEYFKDFVENRVEELSRKADKNRKCRYLSIRIKELQDEIVSRLGKEHSHLLFEYEEAQTHREAITLKILYRQGLLDGIRFANTCRDINGGEVNDLY